jgi:hypothetical protein
MYTDEDLNLAVDRGVFTQSSVDGFRVLMETSKNTSAVDEENFRLIGGFNDIFIVIACSLLLFSLRWVVDLYSAPLALLSFTAASWGVAEHFVRKRKMALPAIALLLFFVSGVFSLSLDLFSSLERYAPVLAAAVTAIAAYIHWLRFQVPITVAAACIAVVGCALAGLLSVYPDAVYSMMSIMFVGGVLVFAFAMFWDSSDLARTTRRSDVAFWLHLLSAPLIIHPIFSGLGIFEGSDSLLNMTIVIALYLVMTTLSLAVDRRAFMVSSLIYVIYAVSSLVKSFGGVGYSFAVTGVIMGGALLLLSAYWHVVRQRLVAQLPLLLQQRLP